LIFSGFLARFDFYVRISTVVAQQGIGCRADRLMREFYTITELTREFGISTRTLRFYEDEGLVAPMRRGRTRLFRPGDRHLIKQILRGKRLGFSIAEIREIIQMYKAPPGEAGQLRVIIDRGEEKRAVRAVGNTWLGPAQ